MENMQVSRQVLVKALREAGHEDADTIIESYSGRGMHGRTCFALRASLKELCDVLTALRGLHLRREVIEPEYADLMEIIEAVEVDALGDGEIVYFPGYELA